MLRHFIYLDSIALGQYISALEGGSLTASQSRSLRSGGGTGGLDAKIIAASRQRSGEEEESRSVEDTNEARFDRLLRAAHTDSERVGWVEILDPKEHFDGIGLGAMLSWECELYVPDTVRALAKSSEMKDALDMMKQILPMAERFGLDTEDLPDAHEVSAAAGLVGALNAKLVVVCEEEGTEWRIAGELDEEFLHSDPEGRAIIVGKVAKVLPKGSWKPYLTFPGMNLLPRDERRRMERQKPEAGTEGDYLEGPAAMVDVLAIYR